MAFSSAALFSLVAVAICIQTNADVGFGRHLRRWTAGVWGEGKNAVAAAHKIGPIEADFDDRTVRQMFHFAAAAYAKTNQNTPEQARPHQVECVKNASLYSAHSDWEHLGQFSVHCAGGECPFFGAKSDRGRQLVFAFRGTQGLAQLFWQIYTGVAQDPVPLRQDHPEWGKVNAYFGGALDRIWPHLETLFLTNPKYQEYSVVFTGHSLGGALASLAAARTRLEGLRPAHQVRLYTFGQPRVGNFQFATQHSAQIPHSFRIVNGEDLVPLVHFCEQDRADEELREEMRREGRELPCKQSKGQHAYHHGTEIWYEKDMDLALGEDESAKRKVCTGQPTNEDRQCRAGRPWKATRLAAYVHDHCHYFGLKISQFGQSGCNVERIKGAAKKAAARAKTERMERALLQQYWESQLM